MCIPNFRYTRRGSGPVARGSENEEFDATISRGVQYVHWVMHKCIMVKVGGKRNTHKVCKRQVNFCENRGEFVKVGAKQGVMY